MTFPVSTVWKRQYIDRINALTVIVMWHSWLPGPVLVLAKAGRDWSLRQLLTVSETLVVTHGVLVLHPLATVVAASRWQVCVNPRQMLVQVGATRYEFPAQPTLQGLRGNPAQLHLVKFHPEGCNQTAGAMLRHWNIGTCHNHNICACTC
jgi:hypothetical protein